MSAKEISFSLLLPSEVPEVLALYQSLYPTLGWCEEALRWQYFENPAGVAQIWAAYDCNTIVSTFVAIPHRMYARGTVGTGWRVQDVMTIQKCRGMGIYHHLSATASAFLFEPKFPLNFTFPNEKSHNAFVRNGWVGAFRLPLWVGMPVTSMRPLKLSAQVEPIHAFGAREEGVWHEQRKRIAYGIDRSAPYLNWRYVANPRSEYFSFRLERDGAELVIVLKSHVREDGTRWSHLVDLFQSCENDGLTSDAFAWWIEFSRERRCSSMSCWTPEGSALEMQLTRAGFVKQTDLTRWMLINANTPDWSGDTKTVQAILGQRNSWHIFMGDSDVF